MTTPRDFVKQDSTLTLQQRCENFLDQLAAKGATDTLFLFEELLEVFPVGRTMAITILRDWQAKRAPSTQCEHGQLARQCLLCEQAAEIERLRAEVEAKWQPIETAPKDRKAVLIWAPDVSSGFCVSWREGYDDSERSGWVIFGSSTREFTGRATHWMPLPAGPSEHFDAALAAKEE